MWAQRGQLQRGVCRCHTGREAEGILEHLTRLSSGALLPLLIIARSHASELFQTEAPENKEVGPRVQLCELCSHRSRCLARRGRAETPSALSLPPRLCPCRGGTTVLQFHKGSV